VFWVVWVVTGLLAATVLASYWHPILALIGGVMAGLIVALIVGAVIVAWPVLRAIWWWATEISVALGLVYGWLQLADHTTLPYRIAVVALIVGPPAAIGPVRRRIIAVAWCLIVRHRLRTCFSEFIITNRTGSLPFITWARPTAVGERVWVWLRPGLALEDIQQRLDLIAVACWAATTTAEAASSSNSAWVRLDIKRRAVHGAVISSPLVSLVPTDTPDTDQPDMPLPTALDLPDVKATDLAPAAASRGDSRRPSPVPSPATPADDDISDWI
jgi:hypothetical protein